MGLDRPYRAFGFFGRGYPQALPGATLVRLAEAGELRERLRLAPAFEALAGEGEDEVS
jgi:hypothetical protein